MTHAASLAASYVASLTLFLIVDIIWIRRVMGPMFERHVGTLLLAKPRLGAAAGFYLFYVAGTLYLAVIPALETGDLWIAAVNGAVVGLLAYGTYEATNFATLKGWDHRLLSVDVAWGTLLTAVMALTGFVVYEAANG